MGYMSYSPPFADYDGDGTRDGILRQLNVGTGLTGSLINGVLSLEVTGGQATVYDGTITLTAGTNMSGGGDFTTNQNTPEEITFNGLSNAQIQALFSGVSPIQVSSGVVSFTGGLNDLSDVTITTPEEGNSLFYNGTNWVNSARDQGYIRVKNDTLSTLNKGLVVYISGPHNANLADVELARANSASTMPAIGVLYQDLSPGDEGLAVAYGRVDGIALPSPTFSEGDTVYVSTSVAGGVTVTKPTGASDLIQNVGIVMKTHATNGVLFVTGVGRSNDVPNSFSIVGDITTTGDVSGADGTFTGDFSIGGKLTVTGLIDPTGLELTPVAANPGGVAANTIWQDSANSNQWKIGANRVVDAGNIGTIAGGAGFVTDLSGFTTSDLTEGTNQYHTTARARGAISVSGDLSYDSGTGVISFTEAYTGTVTSVAATVPTGFTVSGSPVTSTGTLAIGFDTGYSLPTTAKQTNWDTAYGWGDHGSAGYLTSYTETDPVVAAINGIVKSNGSTISAAVAGTDYIATETDPVFSASAAASITNAGSGDVSQGDTAYGWGDHAAAGYLTSETSHADVVVDGDFASQGLMKRGATAGAYSIVTDNSANWNTAFGWGDHGTVGYLTTETYQGTVTSVAITVPTGFSITGSPITSAGTLALTFAAGYSLPTTTKQTNWDTAYGWGDHSTAGYLTSLGTALVDADFATAGLMATDGAGGYSIVADASANWNTAFAWGNHASAGYLTSYTETQTLDDVVTQGSSTTQAIVVGGLTVDTNTLAVDTVNNRVGIGTSSPKTAVTVEGSVTFKEQSAADTDTAAYGQLWVKTATPNELYFTTDAGDDIQITSGTSIAGGGGGSYTDAEAIAAVEGEATLDLTGDVSLAANKELKINESTYSASAKGTSDTEVLVSADATGTNDALFRIDTTEGFLRMGPQNSGYCHFYTDKNAFYFNRNIEMDGGSFYAYNDDLQIKTDDSTTGQPTRIFIDAGVDECRVGIGNGFSSSSLPTNSLHVKTTETIGDDAYVARFQSAEGNVGITRYGGIHINNDNTSPTDGADWDTDRWQISERDGNSFDIAHGTPSSTNVAASATSFRITTGGNVGIGLGNTDPSTKLHVNGTIRQTGATSALLAADANGDIGAATALNNAATQAFTPLPPLAGPAPPGAGDALHGDVAALEASLNSVITALQAFGIL